LDGIEVTPASLGELIVPNSTPVYDVLRRRDLIELFDTTPDLSGNDVDVSRFIRDASDLDVQVAWVVIDDVDGPAPSQPLPAAAERCSVPVGVCRDKKKGWGQRTAWRYDHIEERWVTCQPFDVRPGMVLLFDAAKGGYDPALGWAPGHKGIVPGVVDVDPSEPFERFDSCDTATGADPLSVKRSWLALKRHLAEVEQEVRSLSTRFGHLDLHPQALEAAAVAGRLHDIGKAHECFQGMLAACADGPDEVADRDANPGPWAKSGGSRWVPNERRHFRHELASALALLDGASVALEGVAEPEVVLYLIAAHHGRVRLGFRSLHDERRPAGEPDRAVALGVWDGDELPPVDVPGASLPASTLRLDAMALGRSADGQRSWADRALSLRDREDLGPFRLGFLEAVVRMADWRASAKMPSVGIKETGRD